MRALADLSRNERRFLGRFECWLCEQRLDEPGCASIFGPRCSPEQMAERRERCMAERYRPRKAKAEDED